MNIATANLVRTSDLECWAWQPPKSSWYDHIHARASRFDAAPAFSIDRHAMDGGNVLRSVLGQAANDRLPWLYHPAIRALTKVSIDHDTASETIESQLLLMAWTAAHTERELGGVNLCRVTRLWTPTGVIELAAGWYDLSVLGAAMIEPEYGAGIHLDLYGVTLNACDERALPFPSPNDEGGAGRGDRDESAPAIRDHILAARFLADRFPDIAAWIGNVAKLIIPYRSAPSGALLSGSDRDVPGMIRATMGGGVIGLLEALVHESAHLYFYLVEDIAPIVAADHASLRFASPLKAEPRPLRGVMLAYHALAYITALYIALDHTRVAVDRTAFLAELAGLRAATDAAEATCLGGRHLLTAHGKTFFDQLYGSVRHGRD